MKMRKTAASILILGFVLAGCARIDTGEVGLRRTFGGEIEAQELGTGWHQVLVGDVIKFVTKEILLEENDLTPQSADKSVLKDFDITFTYSVRPDQVAELYTKYSVSTHMVLESENEIFPMGNFMRAIVRTAAYSAVSEFDALDINTNRAKIEQRIVQISNAKLDREGLAGSLKVNMVNVRNIDLAPDVVASANRAVKAQNDLKTKITEVQIADQEAKRIAALSANSGPTYVELLKAQALQTQADALMRAADKGSTIWVVAQNFNGRGSMASAPR